LPQYLKPFFTFYGGKWRAAPHYPRAQLDTIIEPFAGSAGYSLRHYDHKVTLVERDPIIAGTWRYLIGVGPGEILRLPDIELDQTVDDLGVHQEARWLIGWWLKGGSREPVRKPTGWMKKAATPGYKNAGSKSWWSAHIRQRLAEQVEYIRHWKLIEGDYTDAPETKASWFIDPPYNKKAGEHYRLGRKLLDYRDLALWSRSRPGQVIVCEQEGASWLPFVSWRTIRTTTRGGARVSKEVVWVKPDQDKSTVGSYEAGPPTAPGTYHVRQGGKVRMVSVFHKGNELWAWVYDGTGQVIAESKLDVWPENCEHREVE